MPWRFIERKEVRPQMNKSQADFWSSLKAPSCLSTALKIIMIPITLSIARLLSRASTQAISGQVSAVMRNVVIILGLIAGSSFLQILGNVVICRKNAKAMNRCKWNFLEALLKNPAHRLFHADHGALVEHLNDDLTSAASPFVELYPSIFSNTLAAMGYTVFLLVQNPVIAGSLVAIALLQVVPPILVKRYMQVNYEACREIEAKITDHIVEAVEGFEIIKMYNLKGWWLRRLQDCHKEYLKIGQKANETVAIQRSMNRMLSHILTYGTYLLMGIYAMSRLCTIETALQAIYLSGYLFEAVDGLFQNIPKIAISKSAAKRIGTWVWEGRKSQSEQEKSDKKGLLKPVGDQILWMDGSFCYGSRAVFAQADLQLNLHNKYLFLGENGIGKTTLFDLLTGLVLPQGGQIFVGGEVPETFADEVFPDMIFYVPQMDGEFDFSAEELFGMFGAERQSALYQIAERMGLSKDRMKTCAIRELSGGERKKVFLCLGFALDSQLLLLDEPSNSLDDQGKQVLGELLKERQKGTLIISHDLVYEALMDAVYYIKDGRIQHAAGQKDKK